MTAGKRPQALFVEGPLLAERLLFAERLLLPESLLLAQSPPGKAYCARFEYGGRNR